MLNLHYSNYVIIGILNFNVLLSVGRRFIMYLVKYGYLYVYIIHYRINKQLPSTAYITDIIYTYYLSMGVFIDKDGFLYFETIIYILQSVLCMVKVSNSL